MTIKRTAILILGMHRSGTSAVARLLNLRGAAIGGDLLPAKADNERGFWENRCVLDLHESVLRELGLHWHELVTLPPDWPRSAPARRFVAELPALLAEQFGDASLFVVKDPRLSRFAPLWIEALEDAGIRPTFCFTVRHPDEVAASLARRDGFSVTRSHVLWLRHLVDGERATRGHARVFVHYERILADWRGELDRIGKQLAINWPRTPRGFAAAAKEFLTPTLRHHHADNTRTPAIVARAYESVRAATTGPAPPSMFDDSEFEDLMELISPLSREFEARESAQHAAHADEIGRARSAFAEKEAEIDAARTNIEALVREIDQARDAFAMRSTEIDAARNVIAGKDAEIDGARANIEALVREIEQARDAFAAQRTEIEAARSVIAGKDAEIDAARANIEALVRELEQARDAFAAQGAEIDAARAVIAGKDAEIDTARAVITGKDAEIDAARANIDALSAELARTRAALAHTEQEFEALRGDVEDLHGHREEAERVRRQHAQEIHAARARIEALSSGMQEANDALAAKDAEIDAARRNIDSLVAEIDAARRNIETLVAEIDVARGNVDGLAAELEALRRSRWVRLGRSLRLFGVRRA